MATIEELENALRKAHAAGQTGHARRFAEEIRRLRGARADFSGVSARVDSTEDFGKGSGLDMRGLPGMSEADFRASLQGLRGTQTDAEISAEVERNVAANRRAAFRDAPLPVRVMAGVGGRLSGLATGIGQLAGLTDEAGVARERARSAHMADDPAFKGGEIAGDIALLMAPGAAVARAATLPARIAGNAALGAGYAGAQPVAEGESRPENMAVGGLFGALGQATGEGLGALGKVAASRIDPVRQRAIELAREQGIPLHISQLSDSIPVRAAASMAKYLPFSGAGRAASRQQEAFNSAVGRTFGADAGKLTDDVVRGSRKRLSSQFEDIYNRNDVPVGEQGLRKLVEIETEVGRRLTRDESQIVRNQLDSILGELNDAGALTGQKYQALRTQIMKAEGPDKVGQAVKELRKQLDDIAADAVGPDDAAKLKTLRGQWANLRTTEDLLKQVAGAGGDIRPASIWPAIRRGSTQEMRELGRLGQTLLKDSIPDSGTAGRLIAGSLMTGGGVAAGPAALPGLAGMLATGATIGRALNSPFAANLLGQQSGGQALSTLARVAPASGVVAAPVVTEQRGRNKRRNGK